MAQVLLSRLLELLDAKTPEIRRAAVVVLTALKPARDPALAKSLVARLDDDDPEVRSLTTNAVGELRVEDAVPRLIAIVEKGGSEADGAIQALGRLGARGTKALDQVMAHAAPGLRRRIASSLALAGTESAVGASVHTLLDGDPGVVEASARSLAAEIPLLSPAQKKALAQKLMEALAPATAKPKAKKAADVAGLNPVSEAAILRVLTALHAPEAEAIYWSRLDPSYSPALRSAALQALAPLPAPTQEARLRLLLTCAADREFQVVAPALMLLRKIPATRKQARQWLELLQAPDVAAHLLAVEKLREVDTPEVAAALVGQLDHADKGLREAALAALASQKSGRDALHEALLKATTADSAWTLARAQAEQSRSWTPAQCDAVFQQACKWHEADDRRADALWFALRQADADAERTRLEERALALRKKKQYEASLGYWRLLTRDPAVGSALRFELAATLLKLSSKDASKTARDADPALAQFSRLLQDPGFDLLAQIRKAKWLDEEELFYVGFHFTEQTRLARAFGQQLLELVIERSPKSALARNARQKLKSEGL